MSNNKTSLAEARRALINLDFCGPGEHGDGDPEIAALSDAAEKLRKPRAGISLFSLWPSSEEIRPNRLDKTLDDICDLARNIQTRKRDHYFPLLLWPDGH